MGDRNKMNYRESIGKLATEFKPNETIFINEQLKKLFEGMPEITVHQNPQTYGHYDCLVYNDVTKKSIRIELECDNNLCASSGSWKYFNMPERKKNNALKDEYEIFVRFDKNNNGSFWSVNKAFVVDFAKTHNSTYVPNAFQNQTWSNSFVRFPIPKDYKHTYIDENKGTVMIRDSLAILKCYIMTYLKNEVK